MCMCGQVLVSLQHCCYGTLTFDEIYSLVIEYVSLCAYKSYGLCVGSNMVVARLCKHLCDRSVIISLLMQCASVCETSVFSGVQNFERNSSVILLTSLPSAKCII